MSVHDSLARLTAGLDEDERLAHRTAHIVPDARLDWFDAVEAVYAGDDVLLQAADVHREGRITAHVARHDPARVRRQVEAMRAAIHEHDKALSMQRDNAGVIGSADSNTYWGGYEDACEAIIAALASIYPDPTDTEGGTPA